MKIDPQLKRQWQRFTSIKRGYYSLLIFVGICFVSCFLELLINNKALLVKYDGHYYFPTYGAEISGKQFGLDYDYEADYRKLQASFASQESSPNYVIMPLVPYSANEVSLEEGVYPPTAPNVSEKHYLGTDTVGRDVLARLSYGFRIAIMFSLLILLFEYSIGILVGCAMGYFGGLFDLLFQRLIEIWTNVPMLYVIIIIASVLEPNFSLLVAVMVFFGWVNMTWYMRTETYRERARDYVLAARTVGASHLQIIVKHILPNVLAVIITFIPFSVTSGMVALVSLDFLGFGLPSSHPSVGELLNQGLANLEDYWIISSVLVTMVFMLTMVTFIGEGIREAFDPKKFARYE